MLMGTQPMFGRFLIQCDHGATNAWALRRQHWVQPSALTSVKMLTGFRRCFPFAAILLVATAMPAHAVDEIQIYTLKELSTSPALLILPSVSPQPSSPANFPDPLRRQVSGRVAFTALLVLFGRPTTPKTPLPTSLALIGSLPSVPPEGPESPPGVTPRSSVPCRPQTPWCGG